MIPVLKVYYRKIQGETGTLHEEAAVEGVGLPFNCLSSGLNKL